MKSTRLKLAPLVISPQYIIISENEISLPMDDFSNDKHIVNFHDITKCYTKEKKKKLSFIIKAATENISIPMEKLDNKESFQLLEFTVKERIQNIEKTNKLAFAALQNEQRKH